MDNIASNFKIAPMSSLPSHPLEGGGNNLASIPKTFSRETIWGALTGLLLFIFVYYYKDHLLKIYNAGIINYIWSMLYLKSNGEVATTYIPETSLANSLL